MSRYTKDFQINTDWQTVHDSISQYLSSEGYEYLTYEGENVFKKGTGAISGPTFFKFSYSGNMVKMETWMKYAILPGVFVGELTTTGFVGSAARGPWKKRIEHIEQMLGSNFAFNNAPYKQTPYAADPMPYQDRPQTDNTVFCNTCGTSMPASSETCPLCGNRNISVPTTDTAHFNTDQPQFTDPNGAAYPYTNMMPPAGQNVSRKEFIEKYADPGIRKSILSIAITCYICAAVTFIFSIIANPFGIIDAVVLLGLTLAMHIAKSKVCAILLLPLAIFECVVGIIASGTIPFWWLLAGIAAVVTFNKIDKQYKQFINKQ